MTFLTLCRSSVVLGATLGLFACTADEPKTEPGGSSAGVTSKASRDGAGADVSASNVSSHDPAGDASIDPYRVDLLKLGFAGVTKMPLDPHIKNRSRPQNRVVVACLELEQPKLALELAEQVANWRQGSCYAEVAHYLASRGVTDGVPAMLAVAEKHVQDMLARPDEQKWRIDTIRARLSAAYGVRGELEKAELTARDLEPSELEFLVIARCHTIEDKDFGEGLQLVDPLLKTPRQAQKLAGLAAAKVLYDRFFADDRRRAQLTEMVISNTTTGPRLPRDLLIYNYLDFAMVAIDHGATEAAKPWVARASKIKDERSDIGEYAVQLTCRLGAVRFLAGEEKEGRLAIDTALKMYDGFVARNQIVNIYRAKALRTVAEALVLVGDKDQALDVYRRAVEAGVENPNSRPRATDLADTCISIAKNAVKPDTALMTRLREVADALSDPW